MKNETGFGCYFCREGFERSELVEIPAGSETHFACHDCAALLDAKPPREEVA